MLHARWPQRGPFGKPADQLIEKLFRADLEMERVSAVLHAYIKELTSLSSVAGRNKKRGCLFVCCCVLSTHSEG